MPIDAVWMVATVPQKNFERSLIALKNNAEYVADDTEEKLKDDYYEVSEERRKPYMEKILENALEYLNIHDSVWVSSKNGHYFHVYFTCDLDSNDHAMHYMKSIGIGSQRNSTIGYIPFSLFYFNEKPDPNDPYNYNFIKTVTSRLTVAQVVEGVRNGSLITFDYYMYLLWSCTIAAMGIMNTSPIDVAASMMIEPLMGCVMAISFGMAIHNRGLLWVGVKGLVVGMIFCLIFGYIYGMIFQIWRVAWNPPGGWPTPEMMSRGQYKSLIYGSVIATAGGAVLAIIILKNNLVAMTGVAVATTFMPPILNTGLCWALATHLQIDGGYQEYQTYNISGTIYHFKPAWAPPDGYEVQYVNDMRIECLILGAISAAYTGINIFWLLFASYAFLKIKEIAPIKNMMPNEHKFFSEDIKVYRSHQKRYPDSGNGDIGKQILEEWADISGLNKNKLLANNPDAKATQMQTLQDIADDVEADPNYQMITRGAYGSKYQPQLRRRLTQSQIDNSGIADNLRNTRLNNLGIYTIEGGGTSGEATSGESAPPAPAGYASIRRSTRRGPIPYANMNNNPQSVWPSNQQQGVRNRSRSSSIASAQYYNEQFVNNNFNLAGSKL